MIDWMESDKPYLMKQYFVDKSKRSPLAVLKSMDGSC